MTLIRVFVTRGRKQKKKPRVTLALHCWEQEAKGISKREIDEPAECEMVLSGGMNEICIAQEASCRSSNGCHFVTYVDNQLRRFGNHASCAGYPDDQANCPIT
jgi:hypothetical protein